MNYKRILQRVNQDFTAGFIVKNGGKIIIFQRGFWSRARVSGCCFRYRSTSQNAQVLVIHLFGREEESALFQFHRFPRSGVAVFVGDGFVHFPPGQVVIFPPNDLTPARKNKLEKK